MTGYYVKRQDIFLGKELKYGETAGNTFLRLSNEKGKWVRPVHEVWEVEGERKTLKNPLIHESARTVSEFVEKLNYYTDINAKHLFDQKVSVSWYHILFYPIGKFLNNYIVKQGFRDGTHGFIHACFMSFHSFLTRGKLWLMYNTNRMR